MKFQNPNIHGSKEMKGLKSVMYERTDGRTDNQAKSNSASVHPLFEVGEGGIKKSKGQIPKIQRNMFFVLCKYPGKVIVIDHIPTKAPKEKKRNRTSA